MGKAKDSLKPFRGEFPQEWGIGKGQELLPLLQVKFVSFLNCFISSSCASARLCPKQRDKEFPGHWDALAPQWIGKEESKPREITIFLVLFTACKELAAGFAEGCFYPTLRRGKIHSELTDPFWVLHKSQPRRCQIVKAVTIRV